MKRINLKKEARSRARRIVGHTHGARRRPARSIVAAALLGLFAAHAIAQSPAIALDIPAEPLGQSLTALARAANVQVIFSTAVTEGHVAPAIRGTLTVEEALQRALSGAHLRLIQSGPRTYTIMSTPVDDREQSALPLVRVNASAESAADVGMVARSTRSGMKTDTPLISIPQAVNVVTRKEMNEKGVQSITQALQYTPGVTTPYSDTDLRYDWLTVRGFTPLRYLDGLRLPFGSRGYAQTRIEPFGLESVEVLKGPASVLYGQSAPGGLVNMVSKTPQAVASREIQLQTGSFGRAQGALDLTGPVDKDGKVLYRFIALARDTDTQIDNLNERRVFVAPSLTFRPTNDTSLTVMAQYQRIQSDGGGAPQALPAIGTLYSNVNGEIPTNRYIGDPRYDSFQNEQFMVGYSLSHRLNDTWQFRQNVRYTDVNTDTQRVQAVGLAANQSTLSRYAWGFPERSGVFTVDNQAEAKFATGPLQHTVLFGVDYQRETSRYAESNLVLVNAINIFNPVYGTTTITRPPLATRINQLRQQVGGYVQDSIAIDRFTFLLGGRYDWAGSQTRTFTASTGNTATVDQSDTAFTGRVGVVYEFDNGIAPYASYSTSFQPQAGSSRLGSPFDPTKGRQTEVGVKYQPHGMDAFVTLSVFDTRQSNVLTPDPLNINYNVQSGEARVRGIELEGKATVLPGLDVTASYAYMNSRVLSANANASGVSNVGNQLAFVPQHQASLWANYEQTGGMLRGAGIGVGLRYLGASYGDAANIYRAPGVVLFDAALSYDLGKSFSKLRGVKVSVNASNLLDRRYVSTCIAATGCYFGNRRTVLGTVDYKF